MGISLLAVPLLMTSCKKQLQEPRLAEAVTNDAIGSPAAAATVACKPTVFAVSIEFPNGHKIWKTIMQKWYGNDGKLAYLKAHLGTDYDTYNSQISIDWGELRYHNNNQVYLWDVLRNRQAMRVTIDAQGKPLASYMDYRETPNELGYIDTSYYHYTGSRLDSILSIRKNAANFPSHLTKFIFAYDAYGNVTAVQSGNYPGAVRLRIMYDYSKPIAGIVPIHQLGMQYTLLDFMDLLHFPIHHQPVRAVFGAYQPGMGFPNDIADAFIWEYCNYVMQDNNLVYSYMNPVRSFYTRKTFYTGWECNSMVTCTGKQRADVNSLEAFRQLYAQPEK
jgi:hypothetical protein